MILQLTCEVEQVDGLYIPSIWGDIINSGTMVFDGTEKMFDVTNVPTEEFLTEPNIIVCQLELYQPTFDWIDTNLPGAILWDEPNPMSPDGFPDAAEYGLRRAHFAKLGVSQAKFAEMFGTVGNPHTRKTGADNCIAWSKTLRKAK